MKLTSASELAGIFGMTVAELHEKRRRKGWPHVRLGRFNVQFTDEQIAAIVAMQSPNTGRAAVAKAPGQTARSASRRRSA